MLIQKIMDGLIETALACEVIRRAEKCDKCPLKNICIEDLSFEDFVAELKVDILEKFIFMAEEITEDEEEASKSEEQKRWEAEAEKWNLRRCDPE